MKNHHAGVSPRTAHKICYRRIRRWLGYTLILCTPANITGFSTAPIRILNPRSRRVALDTLNGWFLEEKKYLEEPKRLRDLTFRSPLLEEGYPPVVEAYENNALHEKPLLLYLPGFDGTWLAPFLQLPELSTEFDVRCLTMTMDDRSTFDDLKSDVIDYIYNEVNDRNDTDAAAKKRSALVGTILSKVFPTGSPISSRPVYLAGESFGGILTLDVARTLLQERKFNNLKGIVLINAATCFDRSRLAFEGPSVAKLPKLLYPVGLLGLLPLFTDEYSLPQLLLILQSKVLPSVVDTPAREAYMGRVAFGLPQKLKYMPQETLQWRLREWLQVGCARMESTLAQLQQTKLRALIVAGEKDMTLPSIAEAERLSSILRNSRVHVVEGAGHASTCGSRMDLAALMRNCFPELRKGVRDGNESKRTAMKPEAAEGQGVYFGMTARYNGKEEGLSPLLYWSKELYRQPPMK